MIVRGRKFNGTIQQLRSVVDLTGVAGEWEHMPSGYWRFRSAAGGIINWWPSTGTFNFQGPTTAAYALEVLLRNVASAHLQKTALLADRTKQ